MSGSENGNSGIQPEQTSQQSQQNQHQVVSPGRVLGARSASPAKRSAADMEGNDKAASGSGDVPGSFPKEQQDGGMTDFDQAMAGMGSNTPSHDTVMDFQETESMETSAMSTNTSATSLQSEAPPPYTAKDGERNIGTNYTTEQIDEQERTVREKNNKELDEGQKGIVISLGWLARVISRSSEGLKSSEYPKEAREGPIGPVDNSDIVAEGAFNPPYLNDQAGRKFIPLKPGLSMGNDYEVLNDEAWGAVVAAYGMKPGQVQIERYARNTAGPDAAHSNIMYEVYPPVFTIRKVPQPKQQDEEEGKRPTTKHSMDKLRLRQEQQGRGQNSPDDAIKLVSSRHEKFQKFLSRSKEAAGIQRATKVKIFKLVDPSDVTLDGATPTTASASSSQGISTSSYQKLVMSAEEFDKLEIGKDLEPVDARDETNNNNYNGGSTMEIYVLAESHTLLLEEQIGGPGGGEFPSAKKKVTHKFNLAKKDGGSRAGSAPASGRTSPAPGGGVMTRGRTRRDGRTRGVVGLTNLGNTCYMNSALQCIRSVEELAVYFLSEKYKKEINTSNPLGHGGVMAKQYANILNSIYGDNASGTVTPSMFKKTIGSIQPMFSGYGQQDSQEFLSFLVDALHEDLNRIIKKPYNENPDSDDKTVHDPQAIIDLGEVYRNNHKARNDSVAMDLFSGFYKNKMECPVCDKISITFDPYSLLTVQLPIENTFQHRITFLPLRGRPVNHQIDIDKNSSIKMLKEYIASKHEGVDGDRLWMIEVYSHKIYKVFDNNTTLAEANIQGNDYIFMYELEEVPTNAPQPPEKKSLYSAYGLGSSRDDKTPEMDDPKADRFAVPVFSRQKNRTGSGFEITLHPMYITVTREEAQDFETILKKVLIAASRLTSKPILTELQPKKSLSEDDEMERDDQPVDGNGQVTDASSSEDGYINVSVNKSERNGDAEPQTNGFKAEDDQPIPADFMESSYVISEALRQHLFAVNYAQADSNMYCASMSSIRDQSVRNMFSRVKVPARRNSVQSSSSDEESTTSTGSGPTANGDDEGSETEEMDKPDIVIGGVDEPLAMPLTPVGDDDNESIGDNAVENNMSRKGRRKNNKHGKGRRNNKKNHGKKGKRGQNQHRPYSSGSYGQQRGFTSKFEDEEDNPYYIKIGEGIVLDWFPEGLDQCFGGSDNDPDGSKGHFVSHSDGKGLPEVLDKAVEEKRNKRELRKKHGITLNDCFVETGKREVLSEDNAWYCNRCKEMRRAAKTLEIWTIPDILVVHLKRFGGTRSFRDKIDVLVDYPIEGLDMTDRIGLKEDGKEYIYDLFAVDNHYGGLGGGHYTAMAKNFNDGQWYDYNDSHCSKLSDSRIHSAAAYLLFYRRRSDKPLGPPELQDLVNEYRNPTNVSESAEETAEESDSGEGRLGGPKGSLLGSSSGLTGAGVAVGSQQGMGTGVRSGGGALSGLGAGSSLITRQRESDDGGGFEVEGGEVYGPARPPQYSMQGESWNFSALGEEDQDAPGRLMGQVEEDVDADGSDTNSMTVGQDNDNDFDNRMDEDLVDWDDAQESSSGYAGRGTPVHSSSPYNDQDDHAIYSSAHEQMDDVLQLEDAGRIGSDGEDDAPTVDIYPGPPTPMQEDGKAL